MGTLRKGQFRFHRSALERSARRLPARGKPDGNRFLSGGARSRQNHAETPRSLCRCRIAADRDRAHELRETRAPHARKGGRSPLISAELERSPPLTRRAREAWPQERRHRVRLVLEGEDRADQLRTAGVATGAPTPRPPRPRRWRPRRPAPNRRRGHRSADDVSGERNRKIGPKLARTPILIRGNRTRLAS